MCPNVSIIAFVLVCPSLPMCPSGLLCQSNPVCPSVPVRPSVPVKCHNHKWIFYQKLHPSGGKILDFWSKTLRKCFKFVSFIKKF